MSERAVGPRALPVSVGADNRGSVIRRAVQGASLALALGSSTLSCSDEQGTEETLAPSHAAASGGAGSTENASTSTTASEGSTASQGGTSQGAATGTTAAAPGGSGGAGAAEDTSSTTDGAPLCSFESGAVDCAALVVQGDPAGDSGSNWTYQERDGCDDYNLEGILFAPQGTGPFGAVVVSHGRLGSPTGYSATLARSFRSFGLVVIATRYTHALDTDGRNAELRPAGADGASEANIKRARKTEALLACVTEVDRSRLAAHGHSMGAFVTAELVGKFPGDFLAASHSAGGTAEDGVATSPAAAAGVMIPYQIHHGENDTIVDIELDFAFRSVLEGNAVPHEFYGYPGYSHQEIATDETMIERIRNWYTTQGVIAH